MRVRVVGKARARLALAAVAGAVLASLVGAGPAAAGPNGGDDAGHYAEASITFSGPGAPGGGVTRRIRVPATCWWEAITSSPTFPVDANDPASVKAWFENLGRHHMVMNYPTEEQIADAIRRAQAGEKITWYHARCVDAHPAEKGFITDLSTEYSAFPTGAPPEPQVEAETLALEARELLVIEEPEVERNPVIPAVGGGTLVGFPTWFWVTNPETALGGDEGERSITATAGPVSATVTATMGDDDFRIASPGGGNTCSAAEAATPYSAGGDPDGACTVTFTKASVGFPTGYPVTASTAWEVAWTGTEADGQPADGGTLDALSRQTTVDIPVAESQAQVIGRAR